ncbi:MAG: hypothetical protein KAJ19_22195 [Gammaproteobacteria bacterium]|nr:hypothetical protein [Gammaproteobacteria bacterium]
MAERKPLVEISGEVQELPAGDNLPSAADILSRTFTSIAIAGAPQYVDGNGSVDNARANAEGTSQVLGLSRIAVGAPGPGQIHTDGVLTLTTGEWDALAGTAGGLTADVKYFLSAAVAGRLVSAAPAVAGQYVVEVGTALSTTELNVRIRRRILKA